MGAGNRQSRCVATGQAGFAAYRPASPRSGRATPVLTHLAEVFTKFANVFSFSPNVFTPSPKSVHFLARCVHFGGRGVQFSAVRRGRRWGTEERRDFPFDKLRAGSSTGSGQVSGDAGMTGMCPPCRANVSSSGPDVSSFRLDVSTFRPNVSSFRPNVSTLAREVWSEDGEKGGRRRASALGMRAWTR